MSLEIKELIAEREIERYQLHSSHLNEQMVHVLKTIGFDKRYQRGGAANICTTSTVRSILTFSVAGACSPSDVITRRCAKPSKPCSTANYPTLCRWGCLYSLAF